MGTLNAIYVRAKNVSIAPVIWKKFPEAKVQSGEEFISFVLPDEEFEPPMKDLAQWSADLATEVIWLSFQSVVDAFQFHHWRGGSLLRSLVFGCYGEEERLWNEVEGQQEPWEHAAFFDPAALDIPLKFAQSEEEKLNLERIWQNEELVPDGGEPNIDARESARKVAEFYKFPGW